MLAAEMAYSQVRQVSHLPYFARMIDARLTLAGSLRVVVQARQRSASGGM